MSTLRGLTVNLATESGHRFSHSQGMDKNIVHLLRELLEKEEGDLDCEIKVQVYATYNKKLPDSLAGPKPDQYYEERGMPVGAFMFDLQSFHGVNSVQSPPELKNRLRSLLYSGDLDQPVLFSVGQRRGFFTYSFDGEMGLLSYQDEEAFFVFSCEEEAISLKSIQGVVEEVDYIREFLKTTLDQLTGSPPYESSVH